MWKWFKSDQDLINENEDLKREVSYLENSRRHLRTEISQLREFTRNRIEYLENENKRLSGIEISRLERENKWLNRSLGNFIIENKWLRIELNRWMNR